MTTPLAFRASLLWCVALALPAQQPTDPADPDERVVGERGASIAALVRGPGSARLLWRRAGCARRRGRRRPRGRARGRSDQAAQHRRDPVRDRQCDEAVHRGCDPGAAAGRQADPRRSDRQASAGRAEARAGGDGAPSAAAHVRVPARAHGGRAGRSGEVGAGVPRRAAAASARRAIRLLEPGLRPAGRDRRTGLGPGLRRVLPAALVRAGRHDAVDVHRGTGSGGA
jgi:hypothetical protein